MRSLPTLLRRSVVYSGVCVCSQHCAVRSTLEVSKQNWRSHIHKGVKDLLSQGYINVTFVLRVPV